MTTLPTVLPLALRDTALTVTELAQGARPADTFESFRATCLGHIADLKAEFEAAGQPSPVIADAAYALCALFDEIALRHLSDAAREAWEREPLQVREFQSYDAGDALIARIEQRLAEPQPVVPLLLVFYTVMGLGFRGRFALDDSPSREQLIGAIDAQLERAGWRKHVGPIVITAGKEHRRWNMPPLAWVAVALAAAGLIYIALDRWLDSSIARLSA
ncbi:type VI secretion system protein ImpK [Ralstonia sp. 25mfcol4.1]|uniref:DotU family type IV/VI secretion system protein n=1 Tax=Burkholderiaceae TaxID=119060 RepID=UPI00087E6B2E|nr:DotU/TssL family secretion system protein [Ralstonia sp. 25mfcol4.1]SDP41103.1 type VI secretion system protein ImpK [Ralstonia sp. 25mfcol4.1]